VLLDFWGTWCAPCVADLPILKRAYDAYHAKGFEILGMDTEHPEFTEADFAAGVANAKRVLASVGAVWPQAQYQSTKKLIDKGFRVPGYPTAILIDPRGVIISLGLFQLRGNALDETLRKIFDKS